VESDRNLQSDTHAPLSATRAGQLQGAWVDGVAVFKGVPLGQAPIGELRWKDAQPAPHWEGVREAVEYAPASMQAPSPFFADMPVSEDCLYLNVWTERPRPGEKLPVMVHIYGGAFSMGSTYMAGMDGTALAKKGVVVVNIPYRVGTLGFLAHPELSAESGRGTSGNYAMSDLILGLKWIRDNIEAFGGDPGNVTVFGCSAGGHLVSYLLASPVARGLFHRAIPESGAQFTHGPENPNMPLLPESERAGLILMERMGAGSLAEMRSIPAEHIVSVQTGGGPGIPMARPNADGYYLPEDPYHAHRSGTHNNVDLITGWCANEGALFPMMWLTQTAQTWRQFAAQLAPEHIDAFLTAYPASDDEQARRSALVYAGDQMFGYQNFKLASEQIRSGARVWLYYFERESSSAIVKEMLVGVPKDMLFGLHCGNTSYSTGNLGDGPMSGPVTSDDVELSKVMSGYYVNFARTGNPNAPGLPEWPAYEGTPQARVLRIGENLSVDELPGIGRLFLLDAIYETRRAREAARR
jgi:para-nitrobenzyl esterase